MKLIFYDLKMANNDEQSTKMEDQEEDFYSNFESFLQNPLGLTKLQIEEKNNGTKNEDLTATTIKPEEIPLPEPQSHQNPKTFD